MARTRTLYRSADEHRKTIEDFEEVFYGHMLSTKSFPRWMGTKITKYPNDILLYQEIIYNTKPDFIVECGTNLGGSALFFAHMLDIIGKGQVISIDKYMDADFQGPFSGGILNGKNLPQHPRITYLTGGSTSHDILAKVREMVGSGSVMASLDSSHARQHVKREMYYYGDIVTSGQYMVVEDSNLKGSGPIQAIEWYMSKTNKFRDMSFEKRFLVSLNPKGWLCKK